MSGSPSVASPSDMFSAENLARVLARIDELEAQSSAACEQLAKQEETIQHQARKIEDLEMKAMILRAKVEGAGDAFFLFPRLPPEVREMIWKQALMPGRVIEVGVRDRKLTQIFGQHKTRPHVTDGSQSDVPFPIPFPIFFETSAPAQFECLLSTCYESRRVAKRAYDVSFTYNPDFRYFRYFEENTSPGAAAISSQMFAKMGIPYRPQFDAMFLRTPDNEHGLSFLEGLCLKQRSGFEFGSITCLAIDIVWLRYSRIWECCFTSRWGPPMLASLQKLIIVNGFDEEAWKFGVWINIRGEIKRFKSPGLLRAAVVKELDESCPLMVALKVEIMTEQELMAMY